MKPLVTLQRILSWLHLCPEEENIHWRKKLAYIICVSTIFVVISSLAASSAVFFVKFVSIDLKQSLFAVFQVIASSSVLCILIIAFFWSHKISAILEDLSAIYDECKCFIEIIFWTIFQTQNLVTFLMLQAKINANLYLVCGNMADLRQKMSVRTHTYILLRIWWMLMLKTNWRAILILAWCKNCVLFANVFEKIEKIEDSIAFLLVLFFIPSPK